MTRTRSLLDSRGEQPSIRLRHAAILAIPLAFALVADGARAAEVIELTQTGCQFLEPEGVDHSFKTTQKANCETINAKTGAERLAKSKTMQLKPGEYVFRVINRNVPYELGFWLRSSDYEPANPVHKLTKTSVSGGGVTLGKSRDYKLMLKPGEYVYSCPLNPTPDYRIVVEGG